MGTVEAKQKCPELVLVSGEDLTPYRQDRCWPVVLCVLNSSATSISAACCIEYRQASKQILAVLQRFGICERGGMDEMLVDVTAEAQNRLHQGFISSQWAAHVHSNEVTNQSLISIHIPALLAFCGSFLLCCHYSQTHTRRVVH